MQIFLLIRRFITELKHFLNPFPGTLGDEVTNFGGATQGQSQMKSKKRKLTPKKKKGGKKRKFV